MYQVLARPYNVVCRADNRKLTPASSAWTVFGRHRPTFSRQYRPANKYETPCAVGETDRCLFGLTLTLKPTLRIIRCIARALSRCESAVDTPIRARHLGHDNNG